MLRYASKIRLTTTLQSEGTAKILTPILEITYTDVQPAAWAAAPELQRPAILFTVEYTMGTTSMWAALRALFAVACSLAGLAALWRLRSWTVRHARSDAPPDPLLVASSVDYAQLAAGVLFTAHAAVLALLPLTFAVCGYLFAFFKLQKAVYLVLPARRDDYGRRSEYSPLEALLFMLFFSQLLHVAHRTWVQCTAGVFLIDWEKGAGGKSLNLNGRRGSGSSSSCSTGGSVWRQLLVANEWNELQGARRSSTALTLFLMAYVLIGLGQQYNATPQPELHDKTPALLNPALRFANSTFFWLAFSGAQWLWRWAIGERYLGEPPEQKLIDLATLAKVSYY
jgi:meckelin